MTVPNTLAGIGLIILCESLLIGWPYIFLPLDDDCLLDLMGALLSIVG